MKNCFKCATVKSFDEFYKHPKMPDGYLNKCKECAKGDARANYRDKHEYYTNYDKHRNMQPHRIAARHQYQQTEAGKTASNKAKARWSMSNPVKQAAIQQVNNAVRDGKLIKPFACESCAKSISNIHGHHDDYSKPLSVRWLCPKCHMAWHRENGEGANAARAEQRNKHIPAASSSIRHAEITALARTAKTNEHTKTRGERQCKKTQDSSAP